MRRLLALFDDVLRKLEAAGTAVAAIAFGLMMMVTVADVVGRYVFNAPLTWSYDLLTGYVMVASFFLAVSAAQATRQHISIDIISEMLQARLRSLLLAPAYLLAILLTSVITWAAADSFIGAWRGNLVMDGVIPWPQWPTHFLVTFGSGILTLRLVVDCLAHIVRAAGGDPGLELDAEHAPSGGAAQ